MKSLFDEKGMHPAVCQWDVTGAEHRMTSRIIRDGFEWGGLDACQFIPGGSVGSVSLNLQTAVCRDDLK